ncbi:hypothetical protein N7461_000909 [Penicillium sp. DV-2018c]|nr:hypothetical protein N7461_000909 [Penicillium sp. DV-2018c]
MAGAHPVAIAVTVTVEMRYCKAIVLDSPEHLSEVTATTDLVAASRIGSTPGKTMLQIYIAFDDLSM